MSVLQATPSIVIEDVDSQPKRLECQSPPNYEFRVYRNNNNVPAPLNLKLATIQPEIDAYVTPLSLCPSPSSSMAITPVMLKDKVMVVAGGAMPPYLATSGSESSFTSVDIGGPFHPANALSTIADSSWNSCDSSQLATGCFDIKSGLMYVTRAIAGNDSKSACEHHRVDITENSLEIHPNKPVNKKKRMSTCSMIGIFFICVAILGLIAVGIAMYIEFVTKPAYLAHSKIPKLNQTTICDYLLSSCDNSTTTEEILKINITDPPIESGRVEAKFSADFINTIRKQ